MKKLILALALMISIGLSLSFEFGPMSFGPKQTKYIQNFESGTLGNWTNSSLWIANTATTPLNGSYSMFFQGTGTGNTRLFAANQTGGTSGWQDVQIIATVKTNGLDDGENITLSVYDGTTWYTIWSQEDVTQQTDTWNLNSTFFNNANFAVNWTCVSNGGANERCWVDDFAIRGTPLGGLRITNLSISPVNGSSVAMNQYSLFNVTATAQCNGGVTGECGDVNASLYYNSTNLVPNKLVNTTTGETPFFLVDKYIRPSSYKTTSTTWYNPTYAYDGDVNDTITYASSQTQTSSYINYTLSTKLDSTRIFYTFNHSNCAVSGNLGGGCGIGIYNWSSNSFITLYNATIARTTIFTNNTLVTKDNGTISSYGDVLIRAISSGNSTFSTNFFLFDIYMSLEKSNPQSCSAMLQGQNCTATWQVNATGTPSTQYWLNVSFNSESSYILPNSTGNFQINISAAGPASYAFTITVPGNNVTNSDPSFPGNPTPNLEFVYNGSGGGSQFYVNASFNYSGATSWQNSAVPAEKCTNTGNVAITWAIKMNNSWPSNIVMFANDTNAIGGTTTYFIFSSSNQLQLSVAISGTKSLWFYMNFSNINDAGGTKYYNQLNHSSS